MRTVVLSFALGVGALSATSGLLAQNAPWPAPPAAARAVYERFAGFYKLVDGGDGYLAYDAAGYMGISMQRPGRARFEGRPTPEHIRTAMAGFTAYWGSFAVNDAAGTITHQTFTALDPAVSGADVAERFALAGNRLTLTSPDGAKHSHGTLTWERLPDLPNLTPLHRQLIGSWKLISTERRNMKGELVRAYPGWTGFIVYSGSGHMLVHMAEPYRRRPVGEVPTAEETMAAYQNYTSYFGRYSIHESGTYLIHHVEGSVNPGAGGTDTQRFFEIKGKQLILRPPAIKTPEGDVIMTNVWERVLG